MKIYKPSNIVPNSAYLRFLVTVLAAGGIIGGLTSLIGSLFYLIILFPVGMGFLGAGATALTVKTGKVRNPIIALLFGGLTGIAIYGSMHLFDYFRFQKNVANELRENYATELQQAVAESGQTEAQVLKSATDAVLIESTGKTGLFGYLDFSAQEGMEITRAGSSGNGPKLSGVGMWIYWAIELAVILGISGLIAANTAKEPFSEESNEWYQGPKRLGNVAGEQSEAFMDFLKNDRYEAAGKLVSVQAEEIPVPSIEVYYHPPQENSDADSILALSNTSLDKNKKIKTDRFMLGSLAPDQWDTFNKAVTQS